jgi:metallo-beta-lactamase family protein
MATLGFYGGVGSVTGANFMLDTGRVAILVDCGLVQGDHFAQLQNFDDFVYDPSVVDVLLVTHAHADHIGRIPKLVRDGFRGRIYSTSATLELVRIMFDDAVGIIAQEADRENRPPLYVRSDVDTTLSLWQAVEYDEVVSLPDDITAIFTDAGHILGSAMVRLERGERSIVFTGDVGNNPQPLLAPPTVPEHYNYLVMESVYGDRVHEEVAERSALLQFHIEETIKRGGTLLIPAFSLERTQGMLFEINNLIELERILILR